MEPPAPIFWFTLSTNDVQAGIAAGRVTYGLVGACDLFADEVGCRGKVLKAELHDPTTTPRFLDRMSSGTVPRVL